MKTIHFLTLLAVAAIAGGCATDGPATNGASVRDMMARQVANPHPQRGAASVDGASAVETFKNYTDSYANPRPHGDRSAFGY